MGYCYGNYITGLGIVNQLTTGAFCEIPEVIGIGIRKEVETLDPCGIYGFQSGVRRIARGYVILLPTRICARSAC